MNFLLLDVSSLQPRANDFAETLVSDLNRCGHRGLSIRGELRNGQVFPIFGSDDLVVVENPSANARNERLLRDIGVDILVVLTDDGHLPTDIVGLGVPEWLLLASIMVRKMPNGNVEIRRFGARTARSMPVAAMPEKLIEFGIELAEQQMALQVPLNDLTTSTIDTLAEGTKQLRRYQYLVADRDLTLWPVPSVMIGGALESIQDGEVLFGVDLWVKGWIDWNPKKFHRLELRIGNRDLPLTILDLRPDVLSKRDAQNPVGFEGRIDIGGLPTELLLEIWIVDSQSIARRWRSLTLWRNEELSGQTRTPLVTGWVKLDGDKLICLPRCADRRVKAIAVYQGGICIGAMTGLEGRNPTAPITIWFATVDRTAALLHVHVFLEDGTGCAWLCLDGKTNDLWQPRHDDPTQGHVITSDTVDPWELEAPAAHEANWTVNGIPAEFIGTHPVIDISHQPGRLVIEADIPGQRKMVWDLWRHCRDALNCQRLPIFTVPPATKGPTRRRIARPRVVLLRPFAAPTDELYILAPLRRLAETGQIDLRLVNTRDEQLTPAKRLSLLSSGCSVIVSRYLPDEWIASLSQRRRHLADVFYVMDDIVTLAEDDPGMIPASYRQRMVGVAHGEFQTLLHLCSRLIVTSERLAQVYASDKTDLLTPPYLSPCGDLDHLEDFSEIRIEYHGTQVHRDDLAFISPALVALCNRYHHVRVGVWMGRSAPEALRGHARIEIKKDVPWEDYKTAVGETRAHIALAPLLGKPYNQGKSFVKILDNARIGAVGLYSLRAPYMDVITHGENGFLLENDPRLWERTLRWLIEHPEDITRTAKAAQDLAVTLGDVTKLERYWSRHLLDKAPGNEVADE
ncbi:glycosyltransferase [Paracoccus litorisediminis]|uniref:Glycosyl transferases group 1 n=1 Tax=Paracoccus litorisediminis TaxID=2006130 RepID=A0A844HQ73_9RHOB|nr:hypothetical protein [Paracoccus litorisediminis]MTH62040.1 hypothetical protein [Paracoccus litorisediminis]